MLGLILCGGQSQRMGSDKGLLQLDKQNWARKAMDTLTCLKIPVKLSVNKKQQGLYTAFFSTDDLVVDNDALSLKGPLLGLLSCHLAYPHEDLFVLACDMPLMEVSLLRKLYHISREEKAAVYVFTNDGEAEPLCGIYTAKGLSLIATLFRKGELLKHSMKYVLDQLDAKKCQVKEEEKKFFSNINTPVALNTHLPGSLGL